jgi:hypothetical protein
LDFVWGLGEMGGFGQNLRNEARKGRITRQ